MGAKILEQIRAKVVSGGGPWQDFPGGDGRFLVLQTACRLPDGIFLKHGCHVSDAEKGFLSPMLV